MTPLQDYLFSLTLHGMKLGLENITYLLEAVGNPHHAYPAVHVGGTNGKGSVLACLDPMFRAAGYKTGRFTSPHIMRTNERFLIDAQPVSNAQLDEAIQRFQHVAQTMPHSPTFFEMCTAIAFYLFAQEAVEVALVEVGMGGRLDSTNVLQPEMTAITNIDLEHTQYLGTTLEAIAGEKSGIIKAKTPVVVGRLAPGPDAVIREKAADLGAPLRALGSDFQYRLEGSLWEQSFCCEDVQYGPIQTTLPLAGRHQGENAAVACAMAQGLRASFPKLDEAAIGEGLAHASWPCRLERVLETPPVIIDVAHNVAGAERLVEALEDCVLVLALSSDKDARGIIQALIGISSHVILSQFEGRRALSLAQLEEAASGLVAFESAPCLEQALTKGLRLSSKQRPLLVTGSIYTAGEARKILIDRFGATALQF